VAGDFTQPQWEPGQIAMARDSSSLGNEGYFYWSAKVSGVPAGAQYKFIVQNDAFGPGNPGGSNWKLDPYCADATSSTGNSLVVDPAYTWNATSFQMPSFNEMVIYELHIGTFNAEPNQIGTFDKAIGRLNYLQQLGVNAIEVMPAENFDTETSMGYNPCLPFAIDDAYGTAKAVQKFVDAAHSRGIAVIFDVVYNHFGPEPAGMGACLWQFDGWSQNPYGGIYLYNDNRASCPWGSVNRPDFGRSEVRQFLCDNAMMWLNQYRADGLRLDSVVNIRQIIDNNSQNQGDNPQGWELLQFINDSKNSSVPWTISIAEDLQNDDWVTKTTGAGGAGFDAQWDPIYRDSIRGAVAATNDQDRDMNAVAAAVGKSYSQAGMFQRIVYVESHDEADVLRLPDVIWRGNAVSWAARKRSTLAAAIVMTSPGIPMIFMGEEFLSWGTWSDQTPLNWPQAGTYSGIVDLYRQLIQLRRNWNNNTAGLSGQNINIFHVNNDAKVIAFHRWNNGGAGDDVIVVANFSTNPMQSYNIGFPRQGTWYLRFNSDWSAYCADFTNVGYNTTAGGGGNQNMPFNGNVGLGPYSCCIFSQ
jgi:1,4-alpha-glucan branching enzyme